ncbi:hypothetical protein ABN254_21620, partial [Providencia rettgeri]
KIIEIMESKEVRLEELLSIMNSNDPEWIEFKNKYENLKGDIKIAKRLYNREIIYLNSIGIIQ